MLNIQTIDALLQSISRKFPSNTVFREKVSGSWRETTYDSLRLESDRIASGLQRLGTSAGAHCALLAPSSPRWASAFFGILRAGAVVVPVDKELKSAELKHVLSDSEAGAIFTTEAYLETLLEITEGLPKLEYIFLLDGSEAQKGPDQETLAAIGALVEDWHRFTMSHDLPKEDVARLEKLADLAYHRLLDGRPQRPEKRDNLFSTLSRIRQNLVKKGRLLYLPDLLDDAPPSPTKHDADDTALILYTSGTTGRSKGAMLSHGNILSNIGEFKVPFAIDEKIHTLSFLPINHVFELVGGILLPLSAGGTVSFAESLKKLGDNLAEVRPTFFLGVPAVYRIFYERIMKNVQAGGLSRTLFALPLARKLVTSKVREKFGGGTVFIAGGAALDPAVARGFGELGLEIFQGYGITETSPVISIETPQKRKAGTVGQPPPGIHVRIVDPNEEGVGEIHVKGPNVMKGYYRNKEATDEVITDGWYHTGDLGRVDEEGFLSICGRVKNLIVTPNGKNVYPEEVENELLKSPYIAEAMIYGHKMDSGAEEVHAIIVPDQEAIDDAARKKGKAAVSPAETEKIVRVEVLEVGKRMADYKRVKKFTLREHELPKTTTRKIKRFAVEASISAEQ